MVAGLGIVKPNTKTPDPDLAWNVVRSSVEKGLLMFSPVGTQGHTVKIAPPLCMTAEQVHEGTAVLAQAFDEQIKT